MPLPVNRTSGQQISASDLNAIAAAANAVAGATASKVHFILVTTNNPPRVDPSGNSIASDASWMVIWVDDGTHTITTAMAHDQISVPGV